MSKTKETKIVGVFDANGVLVNKTIVAIDAEGVDIGDLPTNGTFKYDSTNKTFVPLGHGFGKVTGRSPYESDFLLRRLMEALNAANLPGFEMPFELTEWGEWYDTTMRRRHEELATRPK